MLLYYLSFLTKAALIVLVFYFVLYTIINNPISLLLPMSDIFKK